MVKVGRKALLRLLFGSDDVSIAVSCTPHRQGTVPDGCGFVALWLGGLCDCRNPLRLERQHHGVGFVCGEYNPV